MPGTYAGGGGSGVCSTPPIPEAPDVMASAMAVFQPINPLTSAVAAAADNRGNVQRYAVTITPANVLVGSASLDPSLSLSHGCFVQIMNFMVR